MGTFKQFCQQEPLQEGIMSRVTSFFKKPKKAEKPQLVPTKKSNAYRTHDDIDPADVPVFKPSFGTKKEDELDEVSKYQKDPNITHYKSGKGNKSSGVANSKDGWSTDMRQRNTRLNKNLPDGLSNKREMKAAVKGDKSKAEYHSTASFKRFRKESEGLTKQLKSKGYSGPRVGDDNHLTFTKRDDKKNQVLVDIPGKEYHTMSNGVAVNVKHLNKGELKKFKKEDHSLQPKGFKDKLARSTRANELKKKGYATDADRKVALQDKKKFIRMGEESKNDPSLDTSRNEHGYGLNRKIKKVKAHLPGANKPKWLHYSDQSQARYKKRMSK